MVQHRLLPPYHLFASYSFYSRPPLSTPTLQDQRLHARVPQGPEGEQVGQVQCDPRRRMARHLYYRDRGVGLRDRSDGIRDRGDLRGRGLLVLRYVLQGDFEYVGQYLQIVHELEHVWAY